MPLRKWLRVALARLRGRKRASEDSAFYHAPHRSTLAQHRVDAPGHLETHPSTYQPVSASRKLRLTDLPIDILQLVVAEFRRPGYPVSLPSASGICLRKPRTLYRRLLAFSMVCRLFRKLCLPLLFRRIGLRNDRLIPPTILPMVQVVYIGSTKIVDNGILVEQMLRQMPLLSHAFWGSGGQRGRARGLGRLAAAPALRVLTLSSAWLSKETFAVPDTLRELHLYHPDARADYVALPAAILAEHISCLEPLLTALRHQLECLTVSGESLRLSFIAASPWPCLREFAIVGRNTIADVPWIHVLQCMPQLCSFKQLLHAPDAPTIISPPTPDPPVNFAQFRRLVLAFPSPEDGIFGHVSSDLTDLALRDSPRYYRIRWEFAERQVPDPILSCADTIRIFGVLSVRGLRALELVYLEDDSEQDMLALIAQGCPKLAVLELHRHRRRPFSYFDWYRTGTTSVPVEALARALAAFRALRTAKLNLSLSVANIDAMQDGEFYKALDAFLDAQARLVAYHVPWIERVALLARSAGEYHHWAFWDVFPDCVVSRKGLEEREWDWL